MSSEEDEICKIHAEEDPCNFTTNGSSSQPRALASRAEYPRRCIGYLRHKKYITIQSKIVDDTTSNLSEEVRR
jgi:hypothetical protein